MESRDCGRRSVLVTLWVGPGAAVAPPAAVDRTADAAEFPAGTISLPHPGEIPAGEAPGSTEEVALPAPGTFAPSADKYGVRALIGRGGMGQVLLVEDRDLRREIAMKVLAPDKAMIREEQLRFVAEAQATAQLEHPGILPIHDIGMTPDGEVYFTMKLVRGRTLREILHDLLLGRIEVRREWSLHRLITVLERIAEAVHFAHEKGVVHRDLKPDNIMLGDYGEVHVMDWGIARVRDGGDDDGVVEPVSTADRDAGMVTVDGTIIGTPPYMSPEQAEGRIRAMDRRSDVYALGCILYEMLTLHPAFEGGLAEVLRAVVSGSFAPVERRNPRREVPPALAGICRRAMALLPSARHDTARLLAEELRGWLDGRLEKDRRKKDADVLVERAREAAVRYERLRREVREAEDRVDAEALRVKPWMALPERRGLLDAKRGLREVRRASVLAFGETTRLLEGALLAEEENEAAREVLADLWKGRLVEAEARGEDDDAAAAAEQVRHFDGGRLAGFLKGDGSLHLDTVPAGAGVVLHRLEDRDGVLEADGGRSLGTAPLRGVPLEMGSYLLIVSAPGFRDARYPVHVTRNREWKGRVRLYTDADIGPEFVLVPGGPFLFRESREASLLDLPDFAIQRRPVTFGDWAEFLRALEEREGAAAAEARVPGTKGDGPYMERGQDGLWRPLPNNVEGAARERCIAAFGKDFETSLAVAGVSCDDAVAYCAWKSATTGREWRLPTEAEREKAARGVDGRAFPWGAREDASLAKCRESRPDHPQPEPVGAFPSAVSVYGMLDAAGGVWDWTSTWYDGAKTALVRKGGAWNGMAVLMRCANRGFDRPGQRSGAVGFRCARSLGR